MSCREHISASKSRKAAVITLWYITNLLSFQTDDVGIFRSPLSNEYMHAATAFQLNRAEIIALAENAVNMVFNDAEKSRLLGMFKLFRIDLDEDKVDSGI